MVFEQFPIKIENMDLSRYLVLYTDKSKGVKWVLKETHSTVPVVTPLKDSFETGLIAAISPTRVS